MEITSLDAKDAPPISTEASPDLASLNSDLATSRLSKVTDKNPASDLASFSRTEAPSALPEGLSGLQISHTKQKGDCLYIYSKDREVGCATQILEAIAPSTQDLESSVLFAEGIRRLKLHGNAWALGVDLPIAPSAIIAAEIIAALLTCFQQDPKLAQTKLKLLLQNNCLNLLCETSTKILQAEMAIPMLNTLRTVKSSEYFQAVTVSNRVIGEKKPNWSFEIDLLAIGVQSSNLEISESLEESHHEVVEISRPESVELQPWQQVLSYADNCLIFCTQAWKLIGQTSPQIPSVPICVASLAIGLGATVLLDRTLNHYAQPHEQTKLVIADPKINLQENTPDKGIANKPALNFNIALFNEKLALLDWQITNKKRSPDVLIVGSSRALRGIEPSVLETALINKGYKGASVFNLGIDGATAKVVNLQVTQILSRPQLPRMIIWADGLRAFNSSRSDITYDEITASTGYKQLQETLKNNGINPEPLSPNIATKPENPIAQAFSTIFATSTKRQEVRTSVVKGFDRNTHLLSNSEALIAATMPSTATALDSKGFVAFDVTFDPNTYFQKYPQVPGDYDLDYRNFDTSGSQFDAFANVVDFCRRNNVELLVVNMPLHNTYLDAIRTRYEASFNSRMQELALREGFTYLDISQAIPNQAELFSDPSHLNQKGAIAIAQMLAQNPKIPWQALKNR
jgi:hypothetical protein